MADQGSTGAMLQPLLARGVRIPHPESVQVAEEVEPSRIAAGVTIHPGCRVAGDATSLGPGSELGRDGPVTLRNCQLGERVQLRGGAFKSATFLDDVDVGPNAHVRPGTLLEEGVRTGHAVGLKQTVLLPYVTAGSLVNFCDALMSGGTGPDHHSEIGSSYVHFNFTPRGDKATPSLVGDVPRGVMLDREPVFLGGQGGLVGPVRIGFGSVIPAGTVWRRDAPGETGLLSPGPGSTDPARAFDAKRYGRVARVVSNNLIYVGNLLALRAWYRHVRRPLMADAEHGRACLEGALWRLAEGLAERCQRLEDLAGRLPESLCRLEKEPMDGHEGLVAEQRKLLAQWPSLKEGLERNIADEHDNTDRASYATLRDGLDGVGERTYLSAIRGLDGPAREAGTAWLDGLVDRVAGQWPGAGGEGVS